MYQFTDQSSLTSHLKRLSSEDSSAGRTFIRRIFFEMKAFCRDPFFIGFPSFLIWPSSFRPVTLLCFSSPKPFSRCFFRDIKSVRGSHYNVFAVELELKLKQPSNMIKQTIDSYATTDTIFPHTLCFPAQMEQTAVIGYAGKKPIQTFRSCRFVTNIQNNVKTHPVTRLL